MLLASKGKPVSMSASENITSSVEFYLARRRVCQNDQNLEIRVLRIDEISMASLKDVVVLTQFYRDVHGG